MSALAFTSFTQFAFATTSSQAKGSPNWTLNTQQSAISFDDALSAYNAGKYELALAYAKIAGAAGDNDSQVLAGTILMNGEAGLINDIEAVDWFKKAAMNNNSDAQLALGRMALKMRGGLIESDALTYFSAASQAGRIEARRAIGEMYQKGIGIERDPEKAKIWLRQAADGGDISGARKMGDSLIESDPIAALQWYEKAADAGDADAAYIAAIMYAENLDIRPNSKRAALLMEQAAESGVAGAQADYGLLVYQGAGVDRDINAAAQWFKKSAMAGDSEGQFLYAFTLAKGEGIPQDFGEAYYWLIKSGESGIDDYDTDRKVLKKRLEENVDPSILSVAKQRAGL